VIGLLFLLALAASRAPAASADADPASDVLYSEDAFVPYQPTPSPDATQKLRDTTAAAKSADHPIKVAVIARRTDLGGIPQLFRRPQQYARFLGYEIRGYVHYNDTLLVVMPNGYGLAGPGRAKGRPVLAAAGIPGTSDSTALTQAATRAVSLLEKAKALPRSQSDVLAPSEIHPGPPGTASSDGSGSGVPVLVVVAGAVLLLIAGGLGVWWLVLRRRTPSTRSGD
jgi:hypothetical protein